MEISKLIVETKKNLELLGVYLRSNDNIESQIKTFTLSRDAIANEVAKLREEKKETLALIEKTKESVKKMYADKDQELVEANQAINVKRAVVERDSAENDRLRRVLTAQIETNQKLEVELADKINQWNEKKAKAREVFG